MSKKQSGQPTKDQTTRTFNPLLHTLNYTTVTRQTVYILPEKHLRDTQTKRDGTKMKGQTIPHDQTHAQRNSDSTGIKIVGRKDDFNY